MGKHWNPETQNQNPNPNPNPNLFPNPVPPPAITTKLSASPTSINLGQSSTLTWSTTGATSVSISGVGNVALSGTEVVNPKVSTNYTLTATAANGEFENTTVTVLVAGTPAPSPVVPPAVASPKKATEQLNILSDVAAVKGTLSAIAADARAEYEKLPEIARGEFHAAINALEAKWNVYMGQTHTLFGSGRK